MKYNRTIFFDGFRAFLSTVDKNLNQPRVDALNFLLDMFEKMPVWSDERHVAYALATMLIETAYTFQPIQEFGSYEYFERRYGSATRKGRELGNDAVGEGAKYSGKGYVQLTGETNYEKLELKIRTGFPKVVNDWQKQTGKTFDLTDYAYQAKEPTFAFLIMTLGMFEGLFTGKKFSDYINLQITDYKNARRIINGTDRAEEIAGYARKIEKILKDAKRSALSGESERNALSDQFQAEQKQAEIQAPSPDNSQNAENITNVNTSDAAPKVEAASQLPTTEVEKTKPTGFGSKLVAFFTAIFTGQYIVPQFVADGVAQNSTGIFQILGRFLQGLYENRYLIFAGIVVWIVVKKVNNYLLTAKIIDTNSDPTKGNVVLVENGKQPSFWERLMFWKL